MDLDKKIDEILLEWDNARNNYPSEGFFIWSKLKDIAKEKDKEFLGKLETLLTDDDNLLRGNIKDLIEETKNRIDIFHKE